MEQRPQIDPESKAAPLGGERDTQRRRKQKLVQAVLYVSGTENVRLRACVFV